LFCAEPRHLRSRPEIHEHGVAAPLSEGHVQGSNMRSSEAT
jgi:hypothetical protein